MLIYIFKSVACMAILFVFYKLLLEKENMHVFKRYYLLLALGVALLIPALVFTEYVTVDPVPYVDIQQPTSPADYAPIGVPEALEKDVLDIAPLLWGIYLIGFVFFGLRFIKNLSQIVGRIRKNPKQKSTRFVHVLLQERFPPHTFFKYIFLNRKKLESNEIPKEVLLHEETHAKERHSWDVIFIELLHVVFWFNPLVYLFKKAIKLNHEFLADRAVLNKDIDEATYQNTLLSYLSPDSEHKYQSKMAHAINYSSIKKRFTVMKKNTSKTSFLLRSSLLLPLLALLLLGFSETKFIEVQSTEAIELEEKSSSEKSLKHDESDRKYNDVSTENRTDSLSEPLYDTTTESQRQNVEPLTEQLSKNRTPKNVILYIHKNQILLNNQAVSLNSFSETIDQHTKNWEETDYTSAIVQANHSDTPVSFLQKVEDEFKKTHLSKANSQMKLFPKGYKSERVQDGASRELMKEYNKLAKHYNDMPRNHMKIKQKDVDRLEYIYSLMSEKQKADAEPFPDFPEPPAPPAAPKAPKAKKEAKEHHPPKPIEPKNVNEREEAAMVIQKVIAEQDPYDINTNVAYLAKSPSALPWVQNHPTPAVLNYRRTEPKIDSQYSDQIQQPEGIQQPPSPPEPQSPLDHVIEMAKKGATFYFEGEKITADKAIELLKNNKSLNIDSRGHKGKNPQVRISKNPIIID
ncbi:M56 family metallopeptidase [Maribacter sp. 2307UL18-2]|uniref:M56 family metallopeptidase n=1 Tax=Maribacter sp. 2307UL18-2 TaxID=3386274 RepID=UPI0039BCEEB6